MILKYSTLFLKKLEKLKRRDTKIEQKIDKKLKLLVINRNYPSLRLHKLEAKQDVWSISVDMDLRIIFGYKDSNIILVDIGGHDEVY